MRRQTTKDDHLPHSVSLVVCVGNSETDLVLAGKLKHAPPRAAKYLVGHALACPVSHAKKRVAARKIIAILLDALQ